LSLPHTLDITARQTAIVSLRSPSLLTAHDGVKFFFPLHRRMHIASSQYQFRLRPRFTTMHRRKYLWSTTQKNKRHGLLTDIG
jgi:hypothetical protein